MQQWNLLRRAGDKDPSPRKSFCSDLDDFLTPLQTAGDEYILMGDLNEQLGDSTSGMNAIIAKFGLVDPTASQHGLDGAIPTYRRSNNRLDYIMISHGLAETIWQSGILPFNCIISSDHRGVFIDIDIDIDAFLGGDPSSLMSAILRGIRSTTPKYCVKYVTEMDKYLTEHNIHARVQCLSTQTTQQGLTASLKKKWEGIDQDILRASLHAEKKVTKKYRPPWSLTLHQASMRATYWHIALSGERAKRVVGSVLEALAAEIDWEPEPPPSLIMSVPDIQIQLRLVQKEPKKIRKEASSLRSDMLQE
jgi:hypothetical protein